MVLCRNNGRASGQRAAGIGSESGDNAAGVHGQNDGLATACEDEKRRHAADASRASRQIRRGNLIRCPPRAQSNTNNNVQVHFPAGYRAGKRRECR